MKFIKKIIFGYAVLMVFVLFSGFVIGASDFEVDYIVEKGDIFLDEKAVFEFTINNELEENDRYSIYLPTATDWKLSPTYIEVEKEKARNFELMLNPSLKVEPKGYTIPVRIKSLTTKRYEDVYVRVFVKSYNGTEARYLPNVALTVEIEEEVDPTENLPVTISMRNRNMLDIKNMDVNIMSPLFSKTYSVELSELEAKTQEIWFSLDDYQEPGIYDLSVELSINNKSVSRAETQFEIKKYSVFITSKNISRGILRTVTYINVYNKGNYNATNTVKEPVNLGQGVFTYTTPRAYVMKENGERYLAWDMTLEPSARTYIKVDRNYQWFVAFIILASVCLVLYYLFRTPIIAIKQAKIYGGAGEGVSHFKIKLLIKNRSNKSVNNVKIIERIPQITSFIEESNLGTLKPSKIIKHKKSGTILRWDIDKLDPFEERIITYKLKSSLKLIGNIHLGALKVRFETAPGQERVARSNKVLVSNPFKD